MRKTILRISTLIYIGALAIFNPLRADELVLAEDYPARYVVQQGDTLWDIAELFLRDPWRWPELWSHNQHIADPHWIYPGDQLSLVWLDGQAQLRKVTASDAPQHALALFAWQPYQTHMSRIILLDEQTLGSLAQISATHNARYLLGPGDTFSTTQKPPSEQLLILRPMHILYNVHNEPIGTVMYLIGQASMHNDGFAVSSSLREIRVGDYLYAQAAWPTDEPHTVQGGESHGHVLAGVDERLLLGQYDWFFVGFEASKPAPQAGDLVTLEQASGTQLGQAIIYRTYPQQAAALGFIYQAQLPIQRGVIVAPH